MFFLLRAAFWLSLLILFIPADPTEIRRGATSREISPFEAIGAAHSTFEDVKGFCDRNPTTCDTGRAAFAGFGAKARTGARWVYDQLEGGDDAGTGARPDPVAATSPVTLPPVPASTAVAPQAPALQRAVRGVDVPLPQVRPLS